MSKNDTASSRYPIRVVAERTGLKSHVIRAWERRYGAVEPLRTGGRHRTYSDVEVRRLILLREATQRGHSISRVATFDDAALEQLIAEHDARRPSEPSWRALPIVSREKERGRWPDGGDRHLDKSPPTPQGAVPGLEACFAATQRLGAQDLAFQLECALVELGPTRTLAELVSPFLWRLDDERREGHLRPMHQEMAYPVLRSFIDSLMRRHHPPEDAPRIVVAAPGQAHDVGSYLMMATAVFEGFRVTYLGRHLAAEELVAAAHMVSASAVGLSLASPLAELRAGDEILRLRRHLSPEVPILVEGRGRTAYAEYLKAAEVIEITDLRHLANVLSRLARERRSPNPGGGPPRSGPWASAYTASAYTAGAYTAGAYTASAYTASVSSAASVPSASSAHGRPPGSAGAGAPSAVDLSRTEIYLSRRSRERYVFDESVLSSEGGLLVGNLQVVRSVVIELGHARGDQAFRASRLHALGLGHAFCRRLLAGYRLEAHPRWAAEALGWLRESFGRSAVHQALEVGMELFPSTPAAVSAGFHRAHGDALSPGAVPIPGVRHPERAIEKLWLLWLLNVNPVAGRERELFDDGELETRTGYRRMIATLETFFRRQPSYRQPRRRSVFELLRTPLRAPSLVEQLEIICDLQEAYDDRWVGPLLAGLDALRGE